MRPLYLFDYDGTLAPFHPVPSKAKLRPRTKRLLQKLCKTHDCGIITGRAKADVLRFLKGIRLKHLIGNHGLEGLISPAEAARCRKRTRLWIRLLRETLPKVPHVWIEDKRLTLTLHYRGAKNETALRDTLEKLARKLPGVRVMRGVKVLNLLPTRHRDKGTAVKFLLKKYPGRPVFFVGDDVTDESVFRLRDPRLISIKMGPEKTAARFRMKESDRDKLLKILTTRAAD